MREILQYWDKFISQWKEEHLEATGKYLKPSFFDFMEWLSDNIDRNNFHN